MPCPPGVKEDRLPAAAVARNLEAFLEGRLPAEALQITYSDLHGLWGGLRLTDPRHGTRRAGGGEAWRRSRRHGMT